MLHGVENLIITNSKINYLTSNCPNKAIKRFIGGQGPGAQTQERQTWGGHTLGHRGGTYGEIESAFAGYSTF